MEVTSPKQAPNPSQPSSGPPAGKQDPVWLNDPWKKSAKTSQARWEDLQLQAPIPFYGTDTKPMLQTHRLQVSQARAGVVLTTKQHIAELLKFADKLDLALLVPTIDGSKPPNVYQTFEGPFEITVEDPVTKLPFPSLPSFHVFLHFPSFSSFSPLFICLLLLSSIPLFPAGPPSYFLPSILFSPPQHQTPLPNEQANKKQEFKSVAHEPYPTGAMFSLMATTDDGYSPSVYIFRR